MNDLILRALTPNIDRAREAVQAEQNKRPDATPAEIAQRLIDGTSWKLGTTGFLSGLPSNPLVALPAGAVEVLATLHEQMQLAARVALAYDPQFFETESAVEELMVPLFGAAKIGEALKGTTVKVSGHMTRQAIRAVLKGETLKQFKKLMLKYLGIKITQKALITKTIPIVGGVIGGGWNYAQTKAIGKRVIIYMEQ